jgi:hypothetical protein
MDSVYQLRQDTSKLVSSTAKILFVQITVLSLLGIGLTLFQMKEFSQHYHTLESSERGGWMRETNRPVGYQ